MPKGTSSGEGPFDLKRLQALIEMMEKHGLTEVSLRRGDEQWRLRRGGQETVQLVPAPAAAAPQAAPAAAPAAAAEPAPAPKADGVEITSPTVGTFYAAPNPEDPPFVTVGSQVQPDTVVCIIEAMKVFNQIQAEVAGTISEVLVNNGDPVEFGQPLYRVRQG